MPTPIPTPIQHDNNAILEMIREERLALESLHKRAVKDLEDEEQVRAEYEHRKTRELKLLIKEEE